MEKTKIIETSKVNIEYDESGRKIVNNFLLLETIGKGAYSKVKRAINITTKEEYAVKILNKRGLRKKKKSYGKTPEGNLKIYYMIDDALNEIDIYKSFPCMNDNVLKLYQILNDDVNDKTYLIMELADFGAIISGNEKTGVFSLNSHYDNTKYDEALIKRWILDIARGLAFGHSNNIMHRDIKSDNIVGTKDGKCKIADFGTSVKVVNKDQDKFHKTEGNLFFFPPEFCDGSEKKTFSFKPVDVWAFGVTIYTCIYKKLPFLPDNHSNVMELFRGISEAKVDYAKDGIIISGEMKSGLSHILEKDVKKRFTAEQVVNYPWLNGK